MGTIGIRSLAAGALTTQVDRPVALDSQLAQDVRKAKALKFLIKDPVRTLQQAAMLYVLMNEDIHTQVPGFKNVSEVEEGVSCVDLPPLSAADMAEIDRLYLENFGIVP
jgi:aryl-alcohol dehydrogenase-like predicted oxidoreductase